MVRPDVAPPQMQVRWSDIQGKPDFSDVAELGVEATRGEMKQTMNTVINKLKTTLLIGALFVVGSSLADPEPLFAKADDIPGNQQIMTNVQEYVDAKVAGIPEPDFSTSNETLVATIGATAPAPGNYAAVSNAAMNAVQSQAMTNYATRAEMDVGWWSEWVCEPEIVDGMPVSIEWLNGEWEAWIAGINYGSGNSDTDATYIEVNYETVVTASRHRVAAPVPTKPSDIGAQAALTFDTAPTANSANPVTSGGIKTALDGKASNADATLTPQFSEWTISPSGRFTEVIWTDYWEQPQWALSIESPSGYPISTGNSDPYATYISATDVGDTVYTATRSIIGYTLGSQTNKVLAATNDLVKTQTLTNYYTIAEADAAFGVLSTAVSNLQLQVTIITNMLDGLENALHVINTGTNL